MAELTVAEIARLSPGHGVHRRAELLAAIGPVRGMTVHSGASQNGGAPSSLPRRWRWVCARDAVGGLGRAAARRRPSPVPSPRRPRLGQPTCADRLDVRPRREMRPTHRARRVRLDQPAGRPLAQVMVRPFQISIRFLGGRVVHRRRTSPGPRASPLRPVMGLSITDDPVPGRHHRRRDPQAAPPRARGRRGAVANRPLPCHDRVLVLRLASVRVQEALPTNLEPTGSLNSRPVTYGFPLPCGSFAEEYVSYGSRGVRAGTAKPEEDERWGWTTWPSSGRAPGGSTTRSPPGSSSTSRISRGRAAARRSGRGGRTCPFGHGPRAALHRVDRPPARAQGCPLRDRRGGRG